ncbi:MAG: ubiquinone/menaquinone biosynthesis methyltransferase [Candidatus Hodarchaeales archaeon]|jgi:demethylmenaquinone methyltransferase/2-methoxy-6-polyprenyl-1,4-benzoquinol methylase
MIKPDKSPEVIGKMFDNVSHRYDLMNDLMSGFSHRFTRKFALKLIKITSDHRILDLATGTGDFAFLLKNTGGPSIKVFGLDFSEKMLSVAKLRAISHKFSPKFIKGDIQSLPFQDNYFDICTISYGIRNIQDIYKALTEIKRVTKPKGTLIIVEATPAPNHFVNSLQNFYFSKIVPKIAKFFSSSSLSYTYLFNSIKFFPPASHFSKMMKKAGWINVRFFPKFFGSVTIFQGQKSFKTGKN